MTIFTVDDFIVNQPGDRVAMVRGVDRLDREHPQMSRYTIEFYGGETLRNAPGYLMREATEKEVEQAIIKGKR